MDGLEKGWSDGCTVGRDEGLWFVGIAVEVVVGMMDGDTVGKKVVGNKEGVIVGVIDGSFEGDIVGVCVGTKLGINVVGQ